MLLLLLSPDFSTEGNLVGMLLFVLVCVQDCAVCFEMVEGCEMRYRCAG